MKMPWIGAGHIEKEVNAPHGVGPPEEWQDVQSQECGGDDGRYGKRLPASMARFRCWLIPHVTFLHFICAVPAPRTSRRTLERQDYTRSEARRVCLRLLENGL